MPPKIDPGGIFLASGAALARPEAARRTFRQCRRGEDQPKSGPGARRRDFRGPKGFAFGRAKSIYPVDLAPLGGVGSGGFSVPNNNII